VLEFQDNCKWWGSHHIYNSQLTLIGSSYSYRQKLSWWTLSMCSQSMDSTLHTDHWHIGTTTETLDIQLHLWKTTIELSGCRDMHHCLWCPCLECLHLILVHVLLACCSYNNCLQHQRCNSTDTCVYFNAGHCIIAVCITHLDLTDSIFNRKHCSKQLNIYLHTVNSKQQQVV